MLRPASPHSARADSHLLQVTMCIESGTSYNPTSKEELTSSTEAFHLVAVWSVKHVLKETKGKSQAGLKKQS